MMSASASTAGIMSETGNVVIVVVLAAPKEDRRRFMLHAYDAGMTKGDYVFYTIDMLPDEEVIDPESVWKGNDGRDAEARDAFESVFHVSHAVIDYVSNQAALQELFEIDTTRMWANAQRDGRPAEHRWRPLFNAAKFG